MIDLLKPYTRKQKEELRETIAILEGKQAQILKTVDERDNLFATHEEINAVVMLDIQLAQLRGKLKEL